MNSESIQIHWIQAPIFCSGESEERNDADCLVRAKKEERITVPTRIRQDISSELNHSNLIEVNLCPTNFKLHFESNGINITWIFPKQSTNPYVTEILKMLEAAPKLFASFSWHVLNCISMQEKHVETFKVGSALLK